MARKQTNQRGRGRGRGRGRARGGSTGGRKKKKESLGNRIRSIKRLLNNVSFDIDLIFKADQLPENVVEEKQNLLKDLELLKEQKDKEAKILKYSRQFKKIKFFGFLLFSFVIVEKRKILRKLNSIEKQVNSILESDDYINDDHDAEALERLKERKLELVKDLIYVKVVIFLELILEFCKRQKIHSSISFKTTRRKKTKETREN